MVTQTPVIPAIAGHVKHPTHRPDTELFLIIFDEDILHFRHFAKHVTAFRRIACSSASYRFRQEISSAPTQSLLMFFTPCIALGGLRAFLLADTGFVM
jgi:hypothetical protein